MSKISNVNVGDKFGRLTVVAPTDKRQKGNSCIIWECKCECGNTAFIPSTNLISGNTTSCGCKSRGKDITGQKFGSLTALYPLKERKNGFVVWHCQCDCGNTKDVPFGNLTSGNTKTCGQCNGWEKGVRTGCVEKWNKEETNND